MLTVSHEAEELARRLAVKIGKTPEDVITDAVRARARLLGLTDESPANKDDVIAAARAVVRDYQSLPFSITAQLTRSSATTSTDCPIDRSRPFKGLNHA